PQPAGEVDAVQPAEQPAFPATVFVDALEKGTVARIEVIARLILIAENDAVDRQHKIVAPPPQEVSILLVDQSLFCDGVRTSDALCRLGKVRGRQCRNFSGRI